MAHEAPETSAVTTMSCGGRFVESAALAQNPSALLQPADALVHQAKRGGRNQVWSETLKRRSGHFECPREECANCRKENLTSEPSFSSGA
jgi:hypothetical protein